MSSVGRQSVRWPEHARRAARLLLAVGLAVAAAGAAAQSARATFPGHNGRIAFTTPYSLVILYPTGTGRVPVARPSDCGPAQPGSIRTVAPNGRGVRDVGPPDPSGPIWASWSPRGRQLAIQSVDSGCDYGGSVQIFNTRGETVPGGTDVNEDAGRDVNLLGWVSERRLLLSFAPYHNPAGVWMTTLDAQPLHLILSNPNLGVATPYVEDAIASANGAIVFVRSLSYERPGDVRLLLPHGRSVHLTYGDQPDWAPDARRLVFERDGDLWIVDSRTRRFRRLTRTPNVTEENPVWSPDGRSIAFDAATPQVGTLDRTSVYTMPSRGGSARLLVANGGRPSWQPIR